MSDVVGPGSWAAKDPEGETWADVLSASPTIIHTWLWPGFPLGAASSIGPLFRDEPMHFLLMPSWTIEYPGAADNIGKTANAYLAQHPRHQFTFLGNTQRETELLRAAGQAAETINQNALMDDRTFCILPGVEPVHDAISNARLAPEKRIELASQIESLALVYFYTRFDGSTAEFHAQHARYRAMMPTATFVNELNEDGCEHLPPRRVNAALASARVGLCLSKEEGAMRAAIEYLFAGLSVVSTPSLGGRDYFFDDEFCIVTDPDPRSIREAVDALVARQVSKTYVRAKTLARVERERARYIQLVQDVIDRNQGRALFAERFWDCVHGGNLMRWRSMTEFASTVRSHIDGDDEGLGAGERPIAAAPLPIRRDAGSAIPAVSVVLPTHNRASSLPKAIRSVRGQTLDSWELIIVDDGSTDATSDVLVPNLRDPRIRQIQTDGPPGPGSARNAGIMAAKAEAVAFLDIDDVWFPEKLERFLQAFRQSDDVVLVGSDYLMRDRSSGMQASMKSFLLTTMLRRWERRSATRNTIPCSRLRDDIQAITPPETMLSMTIGGFLWVQPSSAMVRAEAARRAGLFSPTLQRTEDIDLWLKLSRLGRTVYIDEPLAEHDVGEGGGQRHDSYATERIQTPYGEAVDQLHLLDRIALEYPLSPLQQRLLHMRRIALHRKCAKEAWRERRGDATWHVWPIVASGALHRLRKLRRSLARHKHARK